MYVVEFLWFLSALIHLCVLIHSNPVKTVSFWSFSVQLLRGPTKQLVYCSHSLWMRLCVCVYSGVTFHSESFSLQFIPKKYGCKMWFINCKKLKWQNCVYFIISSFSLIGWNSFKFSHTNQSWVEREEKRKIQRAWAGRQARAKKKYNGKHD